MRPHPCSRRSFCTPAGSDPDFKKNLQAVDRKYKSTCQSLEGRKKMELKTCEAQYDGDMYHNFDIGFNHFSRTRVVVVRSAMPPRTRHMVLCLVVF